MVEMPFAAQPSQWAWTNICPTGVRPWLPDTKQLAPCFQQLFLQIPVLITFAILSAYHAGRIAGLSIRRNRVQCAALSLRMFAVLALFAFSVFKFIYARNSGIDFWPIDVLVGCFEMVVFFVHFVFLVIMRKNGSISHRGTLDVRVVWITLFLLTSIWVNTNAATNIWPYSIIAVALHVVYAGTLLPKGEARQLEQQSLLVQERESLLGNRYSRFRDEHDERALGHAQDEAGLLSRYTFYWVNALIKKGVAGYLRRIDDLFVLPECLRIQVLADRMASVLRQSSSLFKSLHRLHGIEFYSIGMLRLLSDMSGFAGPLLLGGLLSHSVAIEVTDEFDGKPYLYALGLFGSTFVSAMSGTHFNWRMSLVTMKMRVGLVTAIYNKSLTARQLDSAGPDILNLMSTDTDRIVNSCISFHSFWSIPFQLIVTLYLLYTQIGAGFIAGVCFALALIPLNRWIAVKIGVYSEQLMRAKDARIAITTETLSGVKNIKLLAWEDVFIRKIQDCRKQELRYLARRKYLDAMCVYFWATTPVLMSLLTFGVSVVLGNSLNAATTFTTVALLNMLIGPLNTFPWVLNGLIEAWVSLKRVQQLIDLPNIDLDSYYTLIPKIEKPNSKHQQETIIQMVDASFSFEKPRSHTDVEVGTVINFRLRDVTLDINQGELVCIEGPVGEGKTTLLDAILGKIRCDAGTIGFNNRLAGVGYVAQSAWLQRGTIRENIIWGSVFDENFYKETLAACALVDDLKALGGDQIGVGEAGLTLSGGQRARVALARAVYQNKPVYIFDDILSGLDSPVAQHIVTYCILGMLKNKTRIIVTEHEMLHLNATQILRVQNGQVTLVEPIGSNEHLDVSDSKLPPHSSLDFDIHEGVVKLTNSVASLLVEEEKEQGYLSADVFKSYWKASGGWIGFLVLCSVVLMQVTRNVSDVWLAHWVSQNVTTTSTYTSETSHFYLSIYASLAVSNSVITLFRSFLFAYAGIRAAKFIHNKMLNNVIMARFQFFDITPLGRILNRFSSDTYTIDDSLPFILNILLAQLAGLIGALIISVVAMPWLTLLVVPLIPVYLNLQSRYRHSSRDIKRLSSNALSPLYAHFTETLTGLSTIRSMGAASRFKRDFLVKLEESIRAQLTASAAQQWLAVRLQLIGSVLVGGSGLVAAVTSSHATSPGLVGLAVSYALTITGTLGAVLSALAETEQELVAVERVNKYSQVDQEVNANGSTSPPVGWPCQGVMSFHNVYLKYRDYLTPALIDINLETTPCERVGLAGRTGAGKSSILSALLRVAPVSHGRIHIDGVDISTLPLYVLRSRIALVPQQPFLFSGTIRENMDPRGFHLDSKIWSALSDCRATPLVQSLGGLNAQLDSAGGNLSAGQKQLLCLARAILKNSKVVCIDEGTANLDAESETAIQLVLRTAFQSSTVILIAHRSTSLQNTDRILVLSDGRIIESGPSAELAGDSSSQYHSMMQNHRDKRISESSSVADSTSID